MRAILSPYSQQQQQQHSDGDGDGGDSHTILHAYIQCAECITSRHLLSKTLASVLASLGLPEDAVKDTVDHVSGLAVVLKDVLDGRRGDVGQVKKFVLVLDGVEEQREAQQFLLPALARLGEVVSFYTYGC